MQWLGEEDVQAGSQLSLVAKHDTYSISFAWPASSTDAPTGQVTNQSKSTDCASSMARSAAREDGSWGAGADESSSQGSNPLDSAGSTMDAHDTSDGLAHGSNSSAASNSNQGSRDFSVGHDSRSVLSQQELVPLLASGTKQASEVPLMVRCLLCAFAWQCIAAAHPPLPRLNNSH